MTKSFTKYFHDRNLENLLLYISYFQNIRASFTRDKCLFDIYSLLKSISTDKH